MDALPLAQNHKRTGARPYQHSLRHRYWTTLQTSLHRENTSGVDDYTTCSFTALINYMRCWGSLHFAFSASELPQKRQKNTLSAPAVSVFLASLHEEENSLLIFSSDLSHEQ